LRFVIAFVITIAGALALLQIPVASFPTSCRRRSRFGGVSRRLRRGVESSVAQPLEAQVVGVDKMLYMKSTSGNDGSYTLTVSFALGTDPDITRQRQQPRAERTRRNCRPSAGAGPDVQRNPRPCCSHRAVSKTASRIHCSSQLRIINVLMRSRARPAVGQASLFAS